jgi:hypothetical protein
LDHIASVQAAGQTQGRVGHELCAILGQLLVGSFEELIFHELAKLAVPCTHTHAPNRQRFQQFFEFAELKLSWGIHALHHERMKIFILFFKMP